MILRGPWDDRVAGPGRSDHTARGVEEYLLVELINVDGDLFHWATPGTTLEILDHRHDVLRGAFAGNLTDDQSALDVDGEMVSGISLAIVGWVVGFAVLTFLGHKPQFLVELILTSAPGEGATSSS